MGLADDSDPAHSKLLPLRVLLTALRRGEITATPVCMALVSRSFAQLVAKYPAEFLMFIKEMRLEDEAEILEDRPGASTNIYDVHLPRLQGACVRGCAP